MASGRLRSAQDTDSGVVAGIARSTSAGAVAVFTSRIRRICGGGVGAGVPASSWRRYVLELGRFDRGLHVVLPVGWTRRRPLGQPDPRSRRCAGRVPCPRRRRQASRAGIPFHVSNDAKEARAGFDRNRLVAFRIHRSAGAAPAVEPLRVRQRQPADEALHGVVGLGPEHEVPVIRHDAVGEQPSRPDGLGFGDQIDERAIRGARIEEGHAGAGAIGDVVDEVGDDANRSAGHASR